ncbi:MAG TPA: N,N-dimethylformamidase beta subunit family domain-containing protein [Actinomycetota bacterium]|nr:N,N-dimethylformamidase beta subunit family domain-containing protein [Actinomycetota bacterium]
MSRLPRPVRLAVDAVVILAILVGAGVALAKVTGGQATPRTTTPPPQSPGVNPIAAENQKLGTTDWRITNIAASAGIEGYASQVSAQKGDAVTLYVSTSAASFTVQAYRMGYYGGLGARLVWQSPPEKGSLQAAPTVQNGTKMVTAAWRASLTVHIDAAWTPGDYLLKLVGKGGQQRYVPLTVVDYASRAPLLVVNAVTTWEAYNNWGQYNLYNGPDQSFASRSRIVSFDRPYASAGSASDAQDGSVGDGSGDFLGDEFPLVYFAESYGLNVTYFTDVDLDTHGAQLASRHAGIITLGHDEYWTAGMRSAVTGALAKGVNLAFLGANAMFRQIRLQAAPSGPADREIVDYKVASEDPLNGKDDAHVTVNWRDPPVSQPESSVIGQLFECNPATQAPGVVVDAGAWLFADTGLANGDALPNLIGPWYDRVNLAYPTPPNLEVLMHSPVTCPGVGASDSDMTYYAAPSGAGVLATGTTGWVCELTASCVQDPRTHPDPRILQATKNLLIAFGSGPAGEAYPSTSNLAALGIAGAQPARSP